MTDIRTSDSPETQLADGWEWAIVEIMGHRKHAGRVREEERFGAKMLRIDIPNYVKKASLEVVGDADSAGIKPSEPEFAWVTHYYGGSSIFSFTLTDEDSVMRANMPWDAPSRYRLPAPERPEPNHFEGDDDADEGEIA